MSFLNVKSITKKFDKHTALGNVSATIENGELICILGPSGCGKTTLLRIIAGLETADSGEVYINDKDCTYMPTAKRNFGIVFQSYALFPNMTVLGNILFGLRQKKHLNRNEMNEKAHEVLGLVDLTEHKNKYPRQLSGGQQQRTALARAVALSPACLLLDEPLSALDAKVRAKLRGEIKNIQRTLNITTIMVTHDQEEALTMSDRIIVMNNAKIEQVGTPQEIYNNPATPFVANFIGTMNFYGNTNETHAIRPEKIEIVGRHEKHDFSAVIKNLEFKGAFTRIHGVLPELKFSEIFVDIPSESVNSMSLCEESIIYLKTPEEYLVKYAAAV